MNFRNLHSAINDPSDRHAICHTVNNNFHFNLLPKHNKEHTRYIVCPHDSIGADVIRYKQNLTHAIHTTISDTDTTFVDSIGFTMKLNPPIGLTVLNNKSASNTAKDAPLTTGCVCCSLFPEHIDPTIGHVRGIGGGIFKDEYTRACIDKGLNHRPAAFHPRLLTAAIKSVWMQAVPVINGALNPTRSQLAQIDLIFTRLCH
jgi:hypothetical protein